jgi:asparaginyl-tRNA synthetase
VKFEFPTSWGSDLQSEHERYLVEKHFKRPVIITGYPKKIKAFYMKQNDDGKTVRAMDVLFPKIGEIIGGSQREDDLQKLEARIREMGIPPVNSAGILIRGGSAALPIRDLDWVSKE